MGILALAGMVSGAGEGAGKAASQAMTYLSASALQEQRDKMDLRRMELMQGHAEKMQANQQDFARGQQQEQFGHNQLAADLAVRRGEEVAKRERDRQRNPEEIAADAKAEGDRFEAGKGTREAKRTEETQSEIDRTDLLVNSPTYLKAQQALAAAKESPSQRADAALKNFQLEASKEAKQYQDDYVAAVKSGDADKIASAKSAYEAFAQKPWEADKVDAVHAAAGLKEAGIEITRLQSMMKDALPGTPEAQALQRRLSNAEAAHEAYDIRLRQLTGTKQKPTAGMIKIVDPLAKPPGPDSMMAKEKPAPPEKGGLSGYLSENKDKVQDYLASLPPGSEEKPAATQSAAAPPSGDAYVDEKRRELQQRADALKGQAPAAEPPQSFALTGNDAPPSGMIAAAKPSALPPLGTERTGTTGEGRPIIKNGDGSISTERSITVTDPRLNGGKPTNIPSMFDGKEVSEEEAVRRVVEAGGKDPETGQPVQSFGTIAQAVQAARERSSGLGNAYSPQAAATPSERPQPAAQEPDYLDQNTGGPAAPPTDPMTAFATNQPANVPRELQRAEPRGLIAASKPPMEEPGITDPNGPPVEPDAPRSTKAAQPTGRALTPKDLQSLLTTSQKEAIVNMQRRVRSNGINEKPATPGQLQNLLIETYGPIFQRNNQSPAELADAIEMMMRNLLPERPNRKDRR